MDRYEVSAYGFTKENGLKVGLQEMEVGFIQGDDRSGVIMLIQNKKNSLKIKAPYTNRLKIYLSLIDIVDQQVIC